MNAIARMVEFLMTSPGWQPDKWSVQREKTCSRCKIKKHIEKFAFSASLCKACHSELAKQWKKNRSKHA